VTPPPGTWLVPPKQQADRVLEEAADLAQKLGPERAVDDTVADNDLRGD
jgi:hypothetical protein